MSSLARSATVTGVPLLTPPHPRYHRSYLDAIDETGDAHRDGDGDWEMAADPATGFEGYSFTRESLEDPEIFARLVTRRLAEEQPGTPRPEGRVPCTFRWLVDGDTYLGSVAVRHELTPFLLREGGHIGYFVRPSARRRGHATQMLAESLVIAHDLGIDPVLVTCDEDNVGSRTVIERAGGVYEDSRHGTRRYWISA
jgi:predicted acetyltransferase